MSTKYRKPENVPTRVLAKRLDELSLSVAERGDKMDSDFTMRIPAEVDRDADIVLYESAKRLRQIDEREINADAPANYSAEGVQCYLFALLDEAKRRGGMFPQTGDEQRSDSAAVHRVCDMVTWYGKRGEPKPQQVDDLRQLRARNRNEL